MNAYPLSALFINSCNLDITKERMKSLFEFLGLKFQDKLAGMFEINSSEISRIALSASAVPQSSVPASAAGGDAPLKEEAKEEKKEEEEEDQEIDFDIFGSK